jgi:diacylglycerol kinase family enzyme
VQRAVDTLAGTGATLAILPAGTANLLATNLGIPDDVSEAVAIGLHGARRRLDVGRVNGERFAVMAGTGFDALVMDQVDGGLKARLGRASYVLAAARNTRTEPVEARVEVDGRRWFDGPITCLLFGNVGRAFGGLDLFPDADPEDGLLEVGVVTAANPLQWARTVARSAVTRPESSPFVSTTTASRVDVRLKRKLPYEVDGGARPPERRLKVRVQPAAVQVAVPEGNLE